MAERERLGNASARKLHVTKDVQIDGTLTVAGTIIGVDTEDTVIAASGVTQADFTKLHAATGAALASGTKAAAIASPTGGATIDTQARAAIDLIRAALTAMTVSS